MPHHRTTRVVADHALAALLAEVGALETHADGRAVAPELLLRRDAAQLAHLAVPAQQPAHRRDRRREDVARGLAGLLDLVDAVHRLLVHDHHRRSRHDLHGEGADALPGLDHHLARLEHHVLVLERRHLAVQPQPAQRHAPFPALGATQLRHAVPLPVGPPFGVVDQLDEALEADGHRGGGGCGNYKLFYDEKPRI